MRSNIANNQATITLRVAQRNNPASRLLQALCVLTLTTLVTLFLTSNAFANTEQPLLPDDAFHLAATLTQTNTVNVQWQIAPGYFLYRDRLHFTFEPKANAEIKLPESETKLGANNAREEVYENNVTIPITLHTQTPQLQMAIDYQGCSAGGFCYPPTHKLFNLSLTTNQIQQTSIEKPSLQTLLTDQHSVRGLFDSEPLSVMLLIFAGLGLLLAFTPCVLPMIPILTSIIVGHKQPVSTRKAFFLSLTYVLGSSLTYAGAGVLAASMGHSLQAWLQQPWIILAVSVVFVLLALSLFGVYDLRLPRQIQNRITALSRKQESGTYAGVFIMGIVSTLIVSPCVTAPLVGVLMYIAESGNVALGAASLFALGLGMGIPLILIGTTAGKWLPKRGLWMSAVQKAFGVLMLGMALVLVSRVAFFSNMLNSNTVNLADQQFTVVHTVDDLQKQLVQAQAQNKPVILDFYADWCDSCVTMEKNVFEAAAVKKILNDFILLRADLSANNADDEAMLKNYDIIAPPTIIFFNASGKEVNSRRIVGELDANTFMHRVNTFMAASCDKKVAC